MVDKLTAAAKSLQSCPTLCDPTELEPTRLRRPWDSPGKNTGVDCHFLLQRMKVKSESEVAQWCPTVLGLQPTRLLHPWDFPGKISGVGHPTMKGIKNHEKSNVCSSGNKCSYKRILL